MIEPGQMIEIEHNGRNLLSRVITRSEQRKIVAILQQLQKLEESIDSVEKVYDFADQLLALCLPDEPESVREQLSNEDAFAIASKVLTRHMLGSSDKKKLESPRSSGTANYAKVAVPDVLATTLE